MSLTEILTLSGTRGGEAFTLDVAVQRPSKTLAGAATIDNATWDAYTAPQPGGVGPLPCRRTYEGPNSGGGGPTGIPASVSTARCAPDIAAGRTSLHTINIASYPTGAAGGYNSALQTFYNSINHEYVGGIKHEPEDEIITNGTITMADWKSANIHAATVMKNLGKPNLKFSICLRGFRTHYSYGGLEQFWHPAFADLVDYIFFDPYYERFAGIPQTYAGYVAESVTWARSKGKRIGFTEWGVSKSLTDSARAAFVNEAWGYGKAQPDVDFSCYWHHFTGTTAATDYRAEPATWPLTHAALRTMATEGQR